jgi:hypothetical protein
MIELYKFIFVISLALLTTSCASENKYEASYQRLGDLALLQSILRETAMNRWEQNLPKYSPLVDDPQNLSTYEDIGQVSNDAKSIAFRNQLIEDWGELGSTEDLSVYKLCEFWFQGWFGISDVFSKEFSDARAQVESAGLKIETLENITMTQDNRKTINYPAPGERRNLFVCQATTVFRLSRPGFTLPSQSKIAFYYYLENGILKSNFQAQVGANTYSPKN